MGNVSMDAKLGPQPEDLSQASLSSLVDRRTLMASVAAALLAPAAMGSELQKEGASPLLRLKNYPLSNHLITEVRKRDSKLSDAERKEFDDTHDSVTKGNPGGERLVMDRDVKHFRLLELTKELLDKKLIEPRKGQSVFPPSVATDMKDSIDNAVRKLKGMLRDSGAKADDQRMKDLDTTAADYKIKRSFQKPEDEIAHVGKYLADMKKLDEQRMELAAKNKK